MYFNWGIEKLLLKQVVVFFRLISNLVLMYSREDYQKPGF